MTRDSSLPCRLSVGLTWIGGLWCLAGLIAQRPTMPGLLLATLGGFWTLLRHLRQHELRQQRETSR